MRGLTSYKRALQYLVGVAALTAATVACFCLGLFLGRAFGNHGARQEALPPAPTAIASATLNTSEPLTLRASAPIPAARGTHGATGTRDATGVQGATGARATGARVR